MTSSDSSDYAVCFIEHRGKLIPGKVSLKYKAAFYANPDSKKESGVYSKEVYRVYILILRKGAMINWCPCKDGLFPQFAVKRDSDLYVGRMLKKEDNCYHSGQISPKDKCIRLSYDRKIETYDDDYDGLQIFWKTYSNLSLEERAEIFV